MGKSGRNQIKIGSKMGQTFIKIGYDREIEVDPPCDCPKLPDQLVVVARQADGDDVVGKGDPPLGADQGQVVLVCEEVVFWMDNLFRRLQLQMMVGLAEMMMQLL